MHELATARLRLRRFTLDDAPFILGLLNDPGFLRFIGDKGVRDLEGARGYLAAGPIDSYARHGFGLLRVALAETDAPVGMCGLIKRPTLPDPDVGYAFLPAFRGRGYATESTAEVLRHGRAALGVSRVLGITNQDNAASIKVLENVGLRFERMLALFPGEPEIRVYASDP